MKKVIGVILSILITIFCLQINVEAYTESSNLNDFLVDVQSFPTIIENGQTYKIQMVFAEKENTIQFNNTGSLIYQLPSQVGGASIQLSNI